MGLAAIWLLPRPLREQFGFSWGPRRETFMRRLAAGSRASMPWVPPILRDIPRARQADARTRAFLI